MPGIIMSEVFARLGEDKGFRERFAEDPASVLKEMGFDPDQFELPSNIDPDALEERVTRIRRGEVSLEGEEEELANLSAEELWERFSIVRLNAGIDPVAASVVISPATAVVYGTTAVTVVNVTGSGPSLMLSEAQARSMRELVDFNPDELTFSIKGPDGVSVTDLNADAVDALLLRLDP